MANPTVHTVTSYGVGLPYEPLDSNDGVSVPASRSGVAHFRNRGETSATVKVTVPGPFGAMDAELVIPAGADRFVALSPRLSADGVTITFVPVGDVEGAEVAFFERDILDRS
jgi:hypothetical protein